jgi:predicted transglutaminase-like cysteine proteinase
VVYATHKWAPFAIILAGMLNLQPATATEQTEQLETDGKFSATYGATLPPIGFVRFCETNRKLCKPTGNASSDLILTSSRWSDLYQINTRINEAVKPMSDMELYGKPEYWTVANTAGDCEDYLLRKKIELEKLGFDPTALLITVVLDERREGHAVLTVTAADGDYILDNRRNDILRWDATGYTFLKRQSRDNPVKWVSLTNSQPTIAASQMGSQR